jgi:hypothetical protein
MKKALTFFFLLLLLLTSVYAQRRDRECKNGSCIPGILKKLTLLTELYKAECLPPKIKAEEMEKYHKEHPLTEQCWKYITQINRLDTRLTREQLALESKTSCENGECASQKNDSKLQNDISSILKFKPDSQSCNEHKKARIKKRCGDDLKCFFSAGVLGFSGYALEKLVPKNYQPKKCHLGDDSCITKFTMSFLSSSMHFFEGVYDLGKLSGRALKSGAQKLWRWATKMEDHSSTAQLAMAKASEDPSVFNELLTDFPGAMSKIWEAFIHYVKTWLKDDVFCKKWSGLPHTSQCLRPLENFECVPCKELMTGLFCSIPGAVIAEIVPAFLSGGLTAAIKQGTTATAVFVRGIKISKKSMDLMKASRATGLVVKASNSAVAVALKAYTLNPSRNLLKASYKALVEISKSSVAYVSVTPAGRALTFAGSAIKKSTEVLLYPIDNAMTGIAYKAGYNSFDNFIIKRKATLMLQTPVISAMTKANPELNHIMAQQEKVMLGTSDPKELLKLEAELLLTVKPHRYLITKQTLANPETTFQEILTRLYPELKYGDLAKVIPKGKILSAEKELYLELSILPASAQREKLLEDFTNYITLSRARANIVGDAKLPFIVGTKEKKIAVLEKHAAKSAQRLAAQPVEQPLNVPRGLLKLTLPSLMGASETEKVRNKNIEKAEIKKALD